MKSKQKEYMIDSCFNNMLFTKTKLKLKNAKTNEIFWKCPLGHFAIFKAVVTGDPKPDVSWRRAKGNLADKEKFQRKYDESTGEHILEVTNWMWYNTQFGTKTEQSRKVWKHYNIVCIFAFSDSWSVCRGGWYVQMLRCEWMWQSCLHHNIKHNWW